MLLQGKTHRGRLHGASGAGHAYVWRGFVFMWRRPSARQILWKPMLLKGALHGADRPCTSACPRHKQKHLPPQHHKFVRLRRGGWNLEFLRCATRRSQPRGVAPHRWNRLEPAQHFAQDRRRCIVVRHSQPVVHPFSVAARSHHPCAAQVSEMPRYFGLAHAQDLHQVTNANLPIGN